MDDNDIVTLTHHRNSGVYRGRIVCVDSVVI